MIKCIIIEDEELAAKRLVSLIERLERNIVVEALIDTKQRAISYLLKNTPDLIFMDINLSDGISFDIFNTVEKKIPIIFTTAFSEYALKSFEQRSIDYLLKPVSFENLKRSIEKFEDLTTTKEVNHQNILDFLSRNRGKRRFLISWRGRLLSIETNEVAYFYSEESVTFLCDWKGNQYPMSTSLKNLEMELDPKEFFRINKKYLIHSKSLDEMYYTSKSRIKVKLKPNSKDDKIFVAIEKIGKFKRWLSI